MLRLRIGIIGIEPAGSIRHGVRECLDSVTVYSYGKRENR